MTREVKLPEQPLILGRQPEIPALRQRDPVRREGIPAPESTSTAASLVLIPILLGIVGGGGLIATIRWGQVASSSNASRPMRERIFAAPPAARPSAASKEEQRIVPIVDASVAPRTAAPQPARQQPGTVPPALRPWTDRLTQEIYAALSGSGASSFAAGRRGRSGEEPLDDATPQFGPARDSGKFADLDAKSASEAGPAAFGAVPRGAGAPERSGAPARPKLALLPDAQALRQRGGEQERERARESDKGGRGSQSKGIDLTSLAESVKAAKEASSAATAQASAFRQAVEKLDLNFQGPWQQDPVLRELHDAVSRGKAAGLDAADRLENHAAILTTQANALQVDLAALIAFNANPYASQGAPMTAQMAPQSPNISSQLAEMQNAVDTIQRLKEQLPPGM